MQHFCFCLHFSWAELKDLRLFLCTQKAYFSQILFTNLSKSVLVNEIIHPPHRCGISRCWLDSMIIAQLCLKLATIKGSWKMGAKTKVLRISFWSVYVQHQLKLWGENHSPIYCDSFTNNSGSIHRSSWSELCDAPRIVLEMELRFSLWIKFESNHSVAKDSRIPPLFTHNALFKARAQRYL